MRYAINWTEVLESSGAFGNLRQLVNESWPLEKCVSWEYDTSLVQSSIVTDVSIRNRHGAKGRQGGALAPQKTVEPLTNKFV